MLKKITFLFLLNCFTIHAQKKESNEKLYYKQQYDSILKYEHLDTKKALFFCNQFLNKSKENKNIKKELNAYYLAFKIYSIDNNFSQASLYIEKSIELAKKENLILQLMDSYSRKAEFYKTQKGWDDPVVIESYNNALALSKTLEDPKYKLHYLGMLSNFYIVSNNHIENIEIQKKIAYELENIKKKDFENYKPLIKQYYLSLSSTYNLITKSYIKLGDADSSKKFNSFLHENLKENEEAKYQSWLIEYLINEGEIHFLNKEYDLSKKSFVKAYKNNIHPRIIQKAYNYGKLAYHTEKYEEAITILENGIKETVGYKDSYLYLAKSYKQLNNLKKANIYLEKHLDFLSHKKQFENGITSKLRQEEIKQSRLEFEQLKTKKQESENFLLYISIIFSVLAFTTILFLRLSKKKNERKFKTVLEEIDKKDKIIHLLNSKENLPKPAIDINVETVSKILNGLKKLEEKQYNYALSRLKKDKQFRSYSIQSISEEIGYKSTDSFTKYFKKHTGLLPSYFIKKLNIKSKLSV